MEAEGAPKAQAAAAAAAAGDKGVGEEEEARRLSRELSRVSLSLIEQAKMEVDARPEEAAR